jgi:glycosyltransferase involved in cell wall biosynthesis
LLKLFEEESLLKFVAIITRTKNRSLFLERAFQSVSRQEFTDFIWVIVNDGEAIEPVDHIVTMARSRGIEVQCIHNSKSNGMEAASNIGIRNSSSKYIVIHDDDDTWEPAFLQRTVDFLESEQGRRYGGVITDTTLFIEKIIDGKIVPVRKEPFNNWMHAVYLVDMAKSNTFAPISFLYRRSQYDRIGGYDESFPVLGDWKFNIEFLLEGDIALIKEPLANYHKRRGAKDIATGNSITVGRVQHHEFDAVFRNDLLRQEMKDGKFGVGLLVNLVKEYEGSESLLSWQAFKRILKRSRFGWLVRYL